MNILSYQKGRGLKLNDLCVLRHPTLGEIEELGYEDYVQGKRQIYGYELYNQFLFTIILNPRDIADVLWFEGNIWYEDIPSDWLFFTERALLDAKTINVDMDLYGIKGNVVALTANEYVKQALNYFLNLEGEFIFVQKEIGDSGQTQLILCNAKEIKDSNGNITYKVDEDCFKLTEYYYNLIVEYLQKINWIKLDYEFVKGGNRYSKEYILKHLYKKRKKAKTRQQSIDITTINSALIAKHINTWEQPIYTFYECYYRFIKIDEYKNTMSALYSGGIDTKKDPIDWEKINWSSAINI